MTIRLVIKDPTGEAIELPRWFKDLVTLGTIIANWDSAQGRLISVIACPTSRFASAAISLGISWSESKKLSVASAQPTQSRLVDFEYGEYVSLRSPHKQVIGRYLGEETGDRIRIGASAFQIGKVQELHRVFSYGEPKDKSSSPKESEINSISKFIDPRNTLSTLAQTLIVVVGDKANFQTDLQVQIGRTSSGLEDATFQTLSTIVRVKDYPQNFGWIAESLSVEEFELLDSASFKPHLLISNNRSASELSEYQHCKSKTFILDSRDSLLIAHQSIQRYSRYCDQISPKVLGWLPSNAFRGLLMVDRND